MKIFLIISVVLLFSQPSLANFGINCTYSEKSNAGVLSLYNHLRETTAKDYQIANMNKLEYDPELAKIGNGFKSCGDIKHGSNYRVGIMWSLSGYDMMKNWVQKTSKRNVSELNQERYHPRQTGFTRCNLTTACLIEGHEYIIFDIFGSRGTFTEEDLKYGKPASQCSTRPIVLSELCYVEPGSVARHGVFFSSIFFVISFVYVFHE